jgi:hypothetical protein
MSADDVLKSIQDKEVKFVDLRFTDSRGKEMHMSLPANVLDADFFEDGKMFDGSSIAGWKGIQESDMILMPDPDSAILDPFTDESTLNLRCDVIEPSTMQGYERDPRSLAKRAEAYLRSTGVADTAYFGPEPEFFIFDDVRWSATPAGAMYRIDSEEAEWNSERVYDDGNMGHRPGPKGGYFPVPPVDAGHDIRSAMCLAMEEMGVPVEVHHHEVATAGQAEIGTAFNTLVRKADELQILKQRCPRLRQVGHLHAEAAGWRQRQRHARAPVPGQGRRERVFRREVRGPLGDRAALHRRYLQACAIIERLHQLRHQQLQAPGPGIRGAGAARVFREEPLGVGARPPRGEPEGTSPGGPLPGFQRQPLLHLHRDDDGGTRRNPEQDRSGRAAR